MTFGGETRVSRGEESGATANGTLASKVPAMRGCWRLPVSSGTSRETYSMALDARMRRSPWWLAWPSKPCNRVLVKTP